MSVSKAHLQQALQRLHQGKVLVVGDVAIDEMVYGYTERLSREAPVVILRHRNTDIILGAAGNAAHNVAKLGAQKATLLAISGTDYYCSLLLDALNRDGIDSSLLIQDPERPTTTKTRLSGVANQSITQQIVRIDRESRETVSGGLEEQIVQAIQAHASEYHAILLSDYGLGLVTPAIIEACRQAAQTHGLIWAVDSQQDLRAFYGATIITPNQPEAEQNIGYSLSDLPSLLRGGQHLLAQTRTQNILITRGNEGMSLFQTTAAGEAPKVTHIPVFNHSEVFDVTGAGDTVVGTLTLAMATGSDVLTACVLGNLAASLTVKRFGAATTCVPELLDALENLSLDNLCLENLYQDKAKERPTC